MSAFATESSADPELQAENEDEYDEDEDYEEEEEIDTDWVFSSVKRPVDVYLSDEDRWVAATLVRITDSVDRLALVSYDDEDFDDETIPFEDLRPGQLPSKKRQKEKKAAEKRAASNAAAQANQAAAASAASQQSGAVNEIKFRRYLTDMIVNDQFVTASWQPTLEAASAPIIDKLIALLTTFTAANANGPVADLQEFDRSLHQSRNQHDCFLYRNDTYLVQVPLHLPPIVYPAGTFVNKKEQEKQAASRRTQVRLGAFVLSTDGSKVLQFFDEDEYMQKMGTWAHASSDEFAKINLIEFANATGAMPLPVQEPHNQSNKSPVLIARILHAIDEWNANHSGEEVMDLFTIGGDPAGSESASEVGSTGSSSTTVSREDIVAQALQRECHRISTKFVFTATSTFHANGALTQLLDCYRTKLSFTGWQDALRRQHAHGGQEDGTGEKLRSDSVVSASSDQTGKSRSSSIVDATITAGGGGGGKSRSGSLAEPAVAPTNGNKSRSGSIVHEKDLNPPQHGTKSRSGSLADKDLRPPVTSGNKAHPVNTGGLKTVQEKDFKPNSRAARRAAAADDEDEEEPLKVDKVASVDDDGSPAAAKGKKSQPKKLGK